MFSTNRYPVETALFGGGKFAMAFLGSLAHDAGATGSIAALTRRRDDRHLAFERQKGIYHVCLRGSLDGQSADRDVPVEHFDALYGADVDWNDWQERVIGSSTLKRIASNVAETGYAIDADLDRPARWPATESPATHVGRLLCAFRLRLEQALPPIPYLPLELNRDNGAAVSAEITRLLNNWATADADWAEISEELEEFIILKCGIVSTLVDQIVPGYAAPGTVPGDDLALIAEPYREFAIGSERTPWLDLPGAVVNTAEVWRNAERKLGLLNLPHVLMVAWAMIHRRDWDFKETYVYQAMGDVELAAWLDQVATDELVPTLEGRVPDPAGYWRQVRERFLNPTVPYTLWKLAGAGDASVLQKKFLDRGTFMWELYRERTLRDPKELAWAFKVTGTQVPKV